MTRVKICCISSREEAQMAIRHGASALGLVSAMPSGPGVIAEFLIEEIVPTIPPPVASFLLVSCTSAEEIVALQRRCGVNTLQICDRVPQHVYESLRQSLPGISLVQVVHVSGPESVTEALQAAPYVDAILLDSGNQALPVKELGGTGRTHDWSVSARITAQAPVPVFLAGGLNPENVAQAIAAVRPFAVDLCTGVRTEGALDEQKLTRFMAAVAQADAQLG
jgi:phosphoribosylanthranilate isomerase